MPKTIAIAPSWYWPAGVARAVGIPPFGLDDLLVTRRARKAPDAAALVGTAERLSNAEMAGEVRRCAAALRARVAPGGGAGADIALVAGASVEGAIGLLAAAGTALRTLLVDPRDPAAVEQVRAAGPAAVLADAGGAVLAGSAGIEAVRIGSIALDQDGAARDGAAPAGLAPDGAAPDGAAPAGLAPGGEGADVRVPRFGVTGLNGLTWHSQRSLIAGPIALRAFLPVGATRPFVSTAPVSSWDGAAALGLALLTGAPLVLSSEGEAFEAAQREGAGWIWGELGALAAATRDAKREAKALRGAVEGVIVRAPRFFDADDRRRISRQLGCPALTLFGMPETGPIFMSHPSWYLDESIGISLTNMLVVPVDPSSGRPIPTLWELVEFAMVTVRAPSVAPVPAGDGGDGGEGRTTAAGHMTADGRFVTGIPASSDANGMLYLLPG